MPQLVEFIACRAVVATAWQGAAVGSGRQVRPRRGSRVHQGAPVQIAPAPGPTQTQRPGAGHADCRGPEPAPALAVQVELGDAPSSQVEPSLGRLAPPAQLQRLPWAPPPTAQLQLEADRLAGEGGKIGRASCRERGEHTEAGGTGRQTKIKITR